MRVMDLLKGDLIKYNGEEFEVCWVSKVQTKQGEYAFDTRAESGMVARSILPPGFTVEVTRP